MGSPCRVSRASVGRGVGQTQINSGAAVDECLHGRVWSERDEGENVKIGWYAFNIIRVGIELPARSERRLVEQQRVALPSLSLSPDRFLFQ